jgi:hypothetical protein
LRAATAGIIILASILGGVWMCHEWWLRRRSEEREASRQLWAEFEQASPLSDQDVTDEQPEVTLERREPTPLAADH